MREDRGGNPELMALIGKTHLTWKRYLQKALVGEQITLKQYYLLLQLEANSHLYPAQVARMLFCDRPTASVIIKNMERRGWLTRSTDPDNRKQVRLVITGEGSARLRQVRELPELQQRFRSDPLACFSEQEAETFARLIRKLQRYVSERYGE